MNYVERTRWQQHHGRGIVRYLIGEPFHASRSFSCGIGPPHTYTSTLRVLYWVSDALHSLRFCDTHSESSHATLPYALLSTPTMKGRRKTTSTTSEMPEFNSNIIKDQQLVIDTLQKSLGALSQDNVDVSSSLSSLNAKIRRSERHPRSFNVCFFGVPEHDGENCVKLAEKLLLDKFHVGGSQIENAHRTGKAVQGHPRHVIARFYSRVMRMDVLRIYGRTKNKMADVVNRFQMLDEKCESIDELPIDMADTIAAAVQAAFEEDKRNKPKGGTPKCIATGKTRGNSAAKTDGAMIAEITAQMVTTMQPMLIKAITVTICTSTKQIVTDIMKETNVLKQEVNALKRVIQVQRFEFHKLKQYGRRETIRINGLTESRKRRVRIPMQGSKLTLAPSPEASGNRGG